MVLKVTHSPFVAAIWAYERGIGTSAGSQTRGHKDFSPAKLAIHRIFRVKHRFGSRRLDPTCHWPKPRGSTPRNR